MMDETDDRYAETPAAPAGSAALEDEEARMPLAGFDVTVGELADALASTRAATRDDRVCACGHAMTRHDDLAVRGVRTLVCTPVGTNCPCRQPKPVIAVSDTRPFLRKTLGPGPLHALMRGLAGLLEKEGRTWRWLDEQGWPRCELAAWDAAACEGGVVPVPIADSGRVAAEGTAWTAIACRSHTRALKDNGFPVTAPPEGVEV